MPLRTRGVGGGKGGTVGSTGNCVAPPNTTEPSPARAAAPVTCIPPGVLFTTGAIVYSAAAARGAKYRSKATRSAGTAAWGAVFARRESMVHLRGVVRPSSPASAIEAGYVNQVTQPAWG